MTIVKCLTQPQKDYLCTHFVAKTMTQRQLAKFFDVSERTIHRVLEEAGLATTVPRIKGEAYEVMQMLKHYSYSISELNDELAALNPGKEPYVRSAAARELNP